MNFDLIKKLIRLANNNPNENEANLAARKVCSMLDGHEFNQTSIKTAADKIRTGPVTWNDVRRSTEPFQDGSENWTYQPSEAQKRYYEEDLFKDFFWPNRPFRSKPDVDYDKPFYSEPIFSPKRLCPKCGFNMYWNKAHEQYICDNILCGNVSAKPTAKRKCIKCGLEVDTFRIKKEPFICNACTW